MWDILAQWTHLIVILPSPLIINNISSLVAVATVYLNNTHLYFSGMFARIILVATKTSVKEFYCGVYLVVYSSSTPILYCLPLTCLFVDLFSSTLLHWILITGIPVFLYFTNLATMCSTIASLYSWNEVNYTPLLLSIIISQLGLVTFFSNSFRDLMVDISISTLSLLSLAF